MKYYQLDNDTKRYIKRLNYNGFKTPADIYSVDQFIRGLKDLGIYGNMIECWFMRKLHNSGTGATVYAFRDNTNNGTINNSSTSSWTDGGLNCVSTASNSTSNYITMNLKPRILNSATIFGVYNMESPVPGYTNGYNYFDSLSSYNYGGTDSSSLSISSPGGNGNTINASLNNANNTSATYEVSTARIKIAKANMNSSTIKSEVLLLNNTFPAYTTANTIGLLNYDRYIMNGRWNNGSVQSANGSFGVGFTGGRIFSCFFDIDVDFNSFYILFKNTIGKGLNLV